ncbi:Mannose-1-phosphate guanyltransferase alpha-A [Toxocara canis]|uniref:Mannose-1-phosphate guanyltransferase alpha-A n=1 Tax=Toxocara canis TaxID=6265 RepID=A0A0B2VYT7_TOXCA|nr:Mannose-1-phosphate guanyltransferase alpha-A [Toxocara canis]
MSLKAVVLVGGAQKGTRFRPLSLQLPKPLFPIAGVPLIEHHIEQLSKVRLSKCYSYLEEPEALGTAGGLDHFRSIILEGNPSGIFVLNADVCGDLPVSEMVDELKKKPEAHCLLLTTEATRDQSVNFGSVVIDSNGKMKAQFCGLRSIAVNMLEITKEMGAAPRSRVLHYVDKPTTFVSQHISCGVYLLRMQVIDEIATVRADSESRQVWFETEIFPQMAAESTLFALHTTRWWSQTKTAAAVLYANRHYLRLYRCSDSPRLCRNGAHIIGDVFIDPTAEVDPTAKIGPNVSIGAKARVGAGVRVRESIVLGEAVINEHACVLHSVIGWRSVVGAWARVEGTPISPNPNIPFAKLDNKPLFNIDGRLNPSLTILGSDVHVPPETVILNSIVLPYKELNSSYKNQIIL